MTYPAETKAQAMAMLLTGDTPRYVAQQTGIDRRTLRRWRDAAFGQVRGSFGGGAGAGLFDFRQLQPERPQKNAAGAEQIITNALAPASDADYAALGRLPPAGDLRGEATVAAAPALAAALRKERAR